MARLTKEEFMASLKSWKEDNPDYKPVLKTPAEKAKQDPKSMRKAITAFCWSCVGESKQDVANCRSKNCSLYALRPWQGLAHGSAEHEDEHVT